MVKSVKNLKTLKVHKKLKSAETAEWSRAGVLKVVGKGVPHQKASSLPSDSQKLILGNQSSI